MKKKAEKVCFIYNPSAGRGRSESRMDEIRKRIKAIWKQAEFRVTERERQIKEFAREAADTFEMVVACGGDGTVNQVINGMAGSQTPVGVLPLGSGNDFANSIGLSRSFDNAIEVLQDEKVRPTDLIHVTGDADTWCANTLGVGLDGWANYYSSTFKSIRGRTVYALGVLKAVYAFRGAEMRLTIDGKRVEKQMLMVTVCNGSEEGGGFKVAPEADNADGIIDLLIIDKISRARILWYLPKFLFQPKKELKAVSRETCKSLTLESEIPVAVHCDGEFLGSHIQKLEMSVYPGYLNVVVPEAD